MFSQYRSAVGRIIQNGLMHQVLKLTEEEWNAMNPIARKAAVEKERLDSQRHMAMALQSIFKGNKTLKRKRSQSAGNGRVRISISASDIQFGHFVVCICLLCNCLLIRLN